MKRRNSNSYPFPFSFYSFNCFYYYYVLSIMIMDHKNKLWAIRIILFTPPQARCCAFFAENCNNNTLGLIAIFTSLWPIASFFWHIRKSDNKKPFGLGPAP